MEKDHVFITGKFFFSANWALILKIKMII